MKKIKNLSICLIAFICAFICIGAIRVEATSIISTAIAPGLNPGDPDLGSIVLYDDYKIVFNYRDRLKNVNVEVCQYGRCSSIDELENKIYVSGNVLEYDLTKYILTNSQEKEYVIKASGTFYSIDNINRTSIANLNAEVSADNNDSKEGNNSNEILDLSQNAIDFINQFIIPLLYMILAATFIIKAIILSLDIVKYADNRSIRAEKIRGFTYLGVGLLMVAIVNTAAGFITGLFG